MIVAQPQDALAAVGQLGGGLLGFTAIIAVALREIRKGQSEVDTASDNAALSMMERQENQIAQLDQRNRNLQTRVAALEDREREHAVYLQAHAAWDYVAVDTIRKGGGLLGDPPPLYPPRDPG